MANEKHFAVVFTANNARLVMGINPDDYKHNSRAVINPDLSRVRGTPPHFWKRIGDEIHPMSAVEQNAVRAHHAKHGVDNVVQTPASKSLVKPSRWVKFKNYLWVSGVKNGK